MNFDKEIRAIENGYYEQLEYHRIFGADAQRIQNKVEEQLDCYLNFAFLTSAKKLIANVFSKEVTVVQVYAALESATDEGIQVNKYPEREMAELKTSYYGLEIEVTMHLSNNKHCYWEEVGKKEVPVYELRCEEE